jgi:DNA replication protein DnaC
MIDNYLQAVHAKSNYFKLKAYNGEHDKARAAFVKCCKSIVPNWKDNNPEITDQLVKYCIQQDFNGQLDKGILLMGNTGVGKTVYLKALSLMLGYLNNFKYNIYTGFEMERLYQLEPGSEDAYPLEVALGSKMFGIDDLGEEHTSIKRYGTEINVGIDTITRRHQLFTDKGYLTFATTNLNAEMIGRKYGKRIESRIYEMFNIIGVKGKDLRKNH